MLWLSPTNLFFICIYITQRFYHFLLPLSLSPSISQSFLLLSSGFFAFFFIISLISIYVFVDFSWSVWLARKGCKSWKQIGFGFQKARDFFLFVLFSSASSPTDRGLGFWDWNTSYGLSFLVPCFFLDLSVWSYWI